LSADELPSIVESKTECFPTLQDNEVISVPKTAPTSANGSHNMHPTLDIAVNLPRSREIGGAESLDNDLEDDEGSDEELRKERRLQQNRKSAKKCRQKKKAEVCQMSDTYTRMNEENNQLKTQLN